MTRGLDSDQLGQKGERRFADLCISAGLIPNGVSWDRKGWDFVVDWRHVPSELNYDTRPTLPSCLVQVKTQWAGADQVTVPLLALEHIAKDLKPAFLYVIHVIDDDTYGDDTFIAHLDGDLLGLVLKTLRQARVDKARPADKELRLSLKKWFKRIPHDGKALRAAFENAIGPSVGSYAEHKQEQLKSLGFEAGHMELTLKLGANSQQEINDAFLGLRPIEVLDASAVETRFGIAIPIPNFLPPGGELHVLPKPFGHCTIIIRDGENSRPYSFKGEMFGPPKQLLSPGEIQTLIRNELFDLRFNATGIKPPARVNVKLNLTMDGENIRNARVPARKWRDLYGFLAASADHDVSIEMLLSKGRKGPIDGTIKFALDDDDAGTNWASAARLCEITERVFDRAGWPGTKIAIEDIGAAWERLEILGGLLSQQSNLTPLTFTSTRFEGIVDGDQHEMLYIDGIPFGSNSIVYAARAAMVASLNDQDIEWKSESLSLAIVRRIKTRQKDFDKFVEAARNQTGIQSFVAQRYLGDDQSADTP